MTLFVPYERVEQGIPRRMIAGGSGRWVVIEAEQSIRDVHCDVIGVVSSRMG